MTFEITFDYLCPFARNANEAVLNGMANGREWEADFRAFSLAAVHLKEDDAPVFDDQEARGVRALQWGLAIRDSQPEHFPAAHRALFAARHDHAQDIGDEAVIRSALEPTGVDVDDAAAVVASGEPAAVLAKEHTAAVEEWNVFGVPTFIANGTATFVRLMTRGQASDVDQVLELSTWEHLNEFKRTTIPR